MILYNDNTSPYCALVRVAIYAKDAPVQILPPPGGLHSAEYAAISPTATIPCLITDDGQAIPESAVILAFLEDKVEGRRLGPTTPEARAADLLIARLADARLLAPLVQMFHDLSTNAPNARERAQAAIAAGLALIAPLIPPALLTDDAVWQADCVLAPVLFGVRGLLGPELLAPHPSLAAYIAHAAAKPPVAKVLSELAAALAASQAQSPPA